MNAAGKISQSAVEDELYRKFGRELFTVQLTADRITTLWVSRDRLIEVLQFLKPNYQMLYDLFGIDERTRIHREGQPDADFTVVYQLLSFSRNEDLRIKVGVFDADSDLPSAISVWPNANWYEREVWDMFGVTFSGHPN
ncbi:MAG: NADH-quinone oxidoreductase subunit C/D, partial [Oceanicoccus sp.]